ncbi:MAG: family 78 glycoside hydrolase catalytic domain [Abditibacteriota bacterium]|nr:family 78 glycoside hydrolase catalytic domain [Abditibacteriota bacterium]
MFNITNMRIDGLADPVGLDSSSFLLSWQVVSDRMDVVQKTVKVFIYDFISGEKVWENYSTHCNFFMNCSCDLKERHKYHLVLYISDNYDNTARGTMLFTTGLFEGARSFEGAEWLCSSSDDSIPAEGRGSYAEDVKPVRLEHDPDKSYLFVRDIVCGTNVVFAQMNVCALGYCEIALNGKKLSDHVLDPGFTVYDKRALYVSYDVTYLLKKENRISVMLGNGFYNSSAPDAWGFQNARWRRLPKFIMLMDVVYANGKRETFVSDTSFRQHESFVKYQNVRCGELHDMRERTYSCSYMDSIGDWDRACAVPGFTVPEIDLQKLPPVKKLAKYAPVSVSGGDKECVVRFAENITGWAKIQMKGKTGRQVTIEFAERNKTEWPMSIPSDETNGHLVRGQFQTLTVILSGGIDTCEPMFSYNGFQYIIIKNLGYLPEASDITAYQVATDLKAVGDFECSEELLNSIHRMAIRTFRNNYHSIPTDCPHREKNGWTCDGWLASEYGILNFDMQQAYVKWLRDMCDDQYPSGNTSCIVPNPDWSIRDGSLFDVQWTGAMLVIANRLLGYYEDEAAVRRAYPHMEKYISYASSHLNSYLFGDTVQALGDWLDVPPDKPEPGVYCYNTDRMFMNNIFFYRLLQLMTEFTGLVGKDQTEYIKLAENVREAINGRYLRKDGRYFDDSMTSLAMAICFDLPPKEMRELTEKALVEDIERHDRHLNCGITGTRYLFDALSKIGRDDLAVAILKQTDYPSYGFMIQNRATTLWEDWWGGSSLSHPMLGSVDAWLYKRIGGLDYRSGHLTVRIPPASLGITKAETKYQSVYGEIRVLWEYTESALDVELDIPVGIETEYRVLDEKHTLPSGKHAFEYPLDGQRAD